MIVVAGIVNFILVAGVKDGIERASKILMPTLFIMLLVMVIYVLTLDNALLGVKFFLIPDVSKITPAVINGALSQAFFSLSLGMGILITYGSYIDRKTDIVGSAKLVALTDTAVAFTAGLMILPAVFLFNPRKQDWTVHFQIMDAKIEGKTAEGRLTVRLLQLNHPDRIESRDLLVKAKRYPCESDFSVTSINWLYRCKCCRGFLLYTGIFCSDNLTSLYFRSASILFSYGEKTQS